MRTSTQDNDRTADNGAPEKGMCPESEFCGDFEVVVIFTRIRTTLCAMKTAGRLAAGLEARIRVIVPQVLGRMARECRPDQHSAAERRFRTIVGGRKIETQLEVHPCSNRWQMLQEALAPGSIVVLGSACRRWPTCESRLARKLRAAGHDVLLSFE
jgi:hypothetical protein